MITKENNILTRELKKIKTNDAVKRFFTYYSFTIINSIIGFISISFLSKYLEPEQYGMIGIFNSFLYFMPSLLCFSALGLQSISIINLDDKDYVYFRNCFLSFIIILFGFILLIASILLIIYPHYISIALFVLLDSVSVLLITIQVTELVQYKKPILWGILGSGTLILAFLLTLLLVGYYELGWEGRILAILISDVVFLLVRYFKFSSITSNFKFIYDKPQFRSFVHYGFPILLSLGPTWVLANSDRYVLLYFFSMKEVGLYTASFGIASIIGTLNSVVVKVFVPDIYQCLKEKKGFRKIQKISFIYSVIVLFAAAFLSLLSFFCLEYFFGEKYKSTAPIIAIMSFAQAFFGVYCIMGLVLDYYKLNKLKTILLIFSAIICVGISLSIIPFSGVYAPSIGTLFGYAFLGAAVIYKTNQYLKFNNVV